MKIFKIKNKKTGKFIYSKDWTQRGLLSHIKHFRWNFLKGFYHRNSLVNYLGCPDVYEIVEVEIVEKRKYTPIQFTLESHSRFKKK